jgi:LuxR family maltose regulon positive regulatory protein
MLNREGFGCFNLPLRLAKLTPPAPAMVHPRRRLFERLNAARRGRVVWLCAPAGSGKTTLVSSYLAEAGIAPLWYRVDSGDHDPTTFFGYLSRAAAEAVAERPLKLPVPTPAHLGGMDTFARNYFRQL